MSFLTLLFIIRINAILNHDYAALKHFVPRAEDMPIGRRLTAARKSSQLKTRNVAEILTHEQELHYVDCTYSTRCLCR